ncbi:YcgL domain-containing protein [bacterium]|nr:YcgL domain-containing protein [bacterium]
MHIIASIYRSARKQGAYLYVPKDSALEQLPEALRKPLGQLELAMTLDLHPGRQLAHANIDKVLVALQEQGFYLQLPPADQADDL